MTVIDRENFGMNASRPWGAKWQASIGGAALALLTAVMLTAPATAQVRSEAVSYGEKDACLDAARSEIAALGIEADQISALKSVPETGGGAGVGPVVTGVEAWLTPKYCQGHLVFKFDEFCRYKEVYSRGDCKVPAKP